MYSRVQKTNQVYYKIHQTIVGKSEINNNTENRINKTVYVPTQWLKKLSDVNKT
jgi:hypothetical protein